MDEDADQSVSVWKMLPKFLSLTKYVTLGAQYPITSQNTFITTCA